MKVVQLGCGITGLVCAEHLAKNPQVTELVLADYMTDMAQGLRQRLKMDKISVQETDATDEGAVSALLKDADLVVSSIPGYYNRDVMRIAMKTGTHYVDFSLPIGGWHEFDGLVDMCKDADVSILTSMGSDPGISDVFAAYAASKLDEVDQIRTMDGDSATAEGEQFFSLWSPKEMLEEVTVPAIVFRDGKLTTVPPLHERRIYRFPEPIGELPVYNTDHEETFLMSRFINKGVRNVDFRIAIDDDFAEVARVLRMIGLHSLEPIEVKGKQVVPLDVVVALMPRPVDLIGKVKGYAAVVVETSGKLGGERIMMKIWTKMSHEKAYELSRSNATGYLVGTGGAVAAEMVIAGEVEDKGLLVPEQLDAGRYIERLKKYVVVEEQSVRL